MAEPQRSSSSNGKQLQVDSGSSSDDHDKMPSSLPKLDLPVIPEKKTRSRPPRPSTFFEPASDEDWEEPKTKKARIDTPYADEIEQLLIRNSGDASNHVEYDDALFELFEWYKRGRPEQEESFPTQPLINKRRGPEQENSDPQLAMEKSFGPEQEKSDPQLALEKYRGSDQEDYLSQWGLEKYGASQAKRSKTVTFSIPSRGDQNSEGSEPEYRGFEQASATLENGADPSNDEDYIVPVKMTTLRMDPELLEQYPEGDSSTSMVSHDQVTSAPNIPSEILIPLPLGESGSESLSASQSESDPSKVSDAHVDVPPVLVKHHPAVEGHPYSNSGSNLENYPLYARQDLTYNGGEYEIAEILEEAIADGASGKGEAGKFDTLLFPQTSGEQGPPVDLAYLEGPPSASGEATLAALKRNHHGLGRHPGTVERWAPPLDLIMSAHNLPNAHSAFEFQIFGTFNGPHSGDLNLGALGPPSRGSSLSALGASSRGSSLGALGAPSRGSSRVVPYTRRPNVPLRSRPYEAPLGPLSIPSQPRLSNNLSANNQQDVSPYGPPLAARRHVRRGELVDYSSNQRRWVCTHPNESLPPTPHNQQSANGVIDFDGFSLPGTMINGTINNGNGGNTTNPKTWSWDDNKYAINGDFHTRNGNSATYDNATNPGVLPSNGNEYVMHGTFSNENGNDATFHNMLDNPPNTGFRNAEDADGTSGSQNMAVDDLDIEAMFDGDWLIDFTNTFVGSNTRLGFPTTGTGTSNNMTGGQATQFRVDNVPEMATAPESALQDPYVGYPGPDNNNNPKTRTAQEWAIHFGDPVPDNNNVPQMATASESARQDPFMGHQGSDNNNVDADKPKKPWEMSYIDDKPRVTYNSGFKDF